MSSLDVVVLAAGKGTRMKSALPKVLHAVGGRPMVEHVIRTAQALGARQVIAVLGHGIDQLVPRVAGCGADWVAQYEQHGTGHAVQQALPKIPRDDGRTLVLYGDVPLVQAATLSRLLDAAQGGVQGDVKRGAHAGVANASVKGGALVLLTTRLPDPAGYGRILRDADGNVLRIVEQKDATDAERAVDEVNTGIMLVPNAFLHEALPRLSNNNVQSEYYLTDLVAMANAAGRAVVAVGCDADETFGVNDRVQLAMVERLFQRRQAEALMRAGVTLADPARLDIRGELACGTDTTIDVNVLVEGRVVIGAGCRIGANVVLRDCVIADNVEIRSFTHIDGAEIGSDAFVGPFARLRPGTSLARGVHVGNFVETKKTVVGEGSKLNHLTYIGDAVIGRDVNVGAGTITCNYDGVNKFETRIGDGAFIGSNSALVAPVSIGANATVGAGSVITTDVADGQLGVARGKQRNIDGWQRPAKRKD